MTRREFLKLLSSSLLTIAMSDSVLGCTKKVPCDVEGEHAHYYVNPENNMGRYVVSEDEKVQDLIRHDDYILVNAEEKELLDFINENNLFRVNENEAAIKRIINSQRDFIEYEYAYTYYAYPTTYSALAWTKDKNVGSLTGNKRLCHYTYFGYIIHKDEQGNYSLARSMNTDNLDGLKEHFDFVSYPFFKIVEVYDKNKIISFENGINKSSYQDSKVLRKKRTLPWTLPIDNFK